MQVLSTTIAAILLFTIVWIAPEMLLNTIKKVLSGACTAKTGALIILYEIPKILGKAFPVGLLLGSLFTFDKLSKDSELTIFRAVGLSFKRIVAPVVIVSLIGTYLCFLTADQWIPFAEDKIDKIKGKVQYTQFIYTQKDNDGHPTQTVVVSKSKGKALYNITIFFLFQDGILSKLPKLYLCNAQICVHCGHPLLTSPVEYDMITMLGGL